MFDGGEVQNGSCSEYYARLEDCLDGYTPGDQPEADLRAAQARAANDTELAAHLRACVSCREALGGALLSRRLMHHSTPYAVAMPEAFRVRVMAAVREELSLQTLSTSLWRPLEFLASRLALAGAVVLLALSVYLAEFAPPFHAPATNAQSEMSATEVGAGMPEPPVSPTSQDEVLTSLVERTNGF